MATIDRPSMLSCSRTLQQIRGRCRIQETTVRMASISRRSTTHLPLLLCLLLLTPSCQSQSSDSPAPAPGPSTDPSPDNFLNLKQFRAYLVIQRFKRSITCDPLNVTATWVGFRPCAGYLGFYCEGPPDSPGTPTIASVDFNGFLLCAPTLAGFLDQLPDLALFHANSNNFSGDLPDLTALPFLYQIDVSNNLHSGAFPADRLPLSGLDFLDLRFNLFSGAIPASVFSLGGLDALFLNNNDFSQPLPPNLGSFTAAFLTLAYNGFTGPIPASIGNLSNTLREVLFLGNKLSGCLPYEIGFLNKTTVFDAGFNFITGPIPWSFGCLAAVEQLNLAGNLLYGDVPDLVCRLAKDGNLMNLSLSGNYFTSLGLSCWELLKNRSQVLDVRRNCIWGLPDQRTPLECVQFLRRHKEFYCPPLFHVPCTLPKCTVKWPTVWPPVRPHPPAWWRFPATGRPAPTGPSRYVSYDMLQRPPPPPHN